MLKLLGKLTRLCLYLIVLAVVFVACRLAVLYLGWPANRTLSVFATLLALYFLLRWAYRRFLRYREEKHAARVLAADAAIQGNQNADPQLSDRIRQTWKSGLAFLGASRLGRFNFTYALPWYISLSLGDSADQRIIQEAAVSGTSPENAIREPEFAWTFARKAVWLALDFPTYSQPDSHWPLFLAELARNRGRAPIGGVTVILDAEKLAAPDQNAPQRDAAKVRVMLDRLIQVTGARIPVYLLVNRLDRLYGMRSLAQNLPQAILEQPFGAFRLDDRENPGTFVHRVINQSADAITQNLYQVNPADRLGNAYPGGGANAGGSAPVGPGSPAAAKTIPLPAASTFLHTPASRLPLNSSLTAAAALFPQAENAGWHADIPPGAAAAIQAPEEILRLEPALTLFCREAFSDNPYQAVPFLRGLFFGSTGPEGATIKPAIGSLVGFRPEPESEAPKQPWFWRELIEERIPADPVPVKTVRQRRHARAVGAYAGLAIFLLSTAAICWLMTHSFLEQRKLLRAVRDKTAAPAREEELLPYFNLTMGAEEVRNSWWLPRMGMHEGDLLAKTLQERFCDQYADLEIRPAVEYWIDRIRRAAEWDRPAEIGEALLYLGALRESEKMRTITHRGDEEDDLNINSLFNGTRVETPEDRRMFHMYMHWSDHDTWLLGSARQLVDLERHIIDHAMGGEVMRWLPGWVNSLSGTEAVDAAAVWQPIHLPPNEARDLQIAKSWTAGGYANAHRLLELVRYTLDHPREWEAKRDAILRDYRIAALEAWIAAAGYLWRNYPANIKDAAVPYLLRQAGEGNDPATRFVKLANRQLVPIFGGDAVPPDIEWLRLDHQLHEVAAVAAKAMPVPGEDQQPSLIDDLKNRIGGVAKRIGSDAGMQLIAREIGISRGGKHADALAEWQRLAVSLTQINDLSNNRDAFLDTVRQQYILNTNPAAVAPPATPDGAAAGSAATPFLVGKRAAENLEVQLYDLTNSIAWHNLAPKATYNFVRYLATRRAAGYLDYLWLEKVFNPSLMAAGGEDEKTALLFGQGGAVDTFMGATAQGLWRWEKGALANADWEGIPFRFSKDFLDYCGAMVQRGQVKRPEKIALGFRVDAVSVNPDARERPQTVLFNMTEGGEDQRLSYRNYFVSTTFEWKMDKSATAGIRFEFPSLTLSKNYSGDKGFGELIRALDKGPLTLTPADFPGDAEAMRRLGIKTISLRVSLQNQKPLLRFMYEKLPTLPASIVIHDGTGTVEAPETPGESGAASLFGGGKEAAGGEGTTKPAKGAK